MHPDEDPFELPANDWKPCIVTVNGRSAIAKVPPDRVGPDGKVKLTWAEIRATLGDDAPREGDCVILGY